ncbi:TIGR03086 family metal-binding protein [Micromonospora sp. WMMD1120]|uniref:TIGR03086 family metal-binding protein n=1 Tax=Micromonospora sp. WMMD1120 TaxID=3016106 RepID=UPI002416F17C|nr:TIGR03086 family metal-binding protein [Micromonospora sp. WMMD1120]MDG4811348.1 TIGR03086 family metal-binding protein [Micromonospora sp. WMMD1120]
MAATQWRTVLEEAHHALRTAVEGVPSDGWDQPTPCERWTVTQVLQHATGDQLAFAAAIVGGPAPTEDPFAPSGRIEGDKLADLRTALDASAQAWAGVADGDPQVPTPLPQGKLPAPVAAVACALDAAVHAWDIAVATGQPSPLGADLARPLLAVARQIVEPLRAYGAYAPAITTGPEADDLGTLLAYLGRDPRWAAGQR